MGGALGLHGGQIAMSTSAYKQKTSNNPSNSAKGQEDLAANPDLCHSAVTARLLAVGSETSAATPCP